MIMSQKLMNRMIYGVIILFCVTPFLFFLYINTTATMQSVTIVDLLQTTPVLTLQMLAIFLLPLAAYLLKMKWDKVEGSESQHIIYASIALLMVALFTLNNLVHGFLLLILLFFVTKYFHISIKQALTTFKKPKLAFTTYSGEIFLLVVSVFVGLMMNRLM